MSAFDMSLSVFGTSIAVPDEESQKTAKQSGQPVALDVILAVALPLPFQQGPGQPPVMAHLGNVKFSMDKESAEKFFQSGLEAAEQLPATSNLAVVSDLGAAERMGDDLSAMRGNGA